MFQDIDELGKNQIKIKAAFCDFGELSVKKCGDGTYFVTSQNDPGHKSAFVNTDDIIIFEEDSIHVSGVYHYCEVLELLSGVEKTE